MTRTNAAQRHDRLEFAIVLAAELGQRGVRASTYRIAALAGRLIKAHKALRNAIEATDDGCGSMRDARDQEAYDAEHAKIVKRIAAMLRLYGIGAQIGGDPRGCLFQLTLPRTQVKNGFGAKGYCVPR
jgi:hypothetical protein